MPEEIDVFAEEFNANEGDGNPNEEIDVFAEEFNTYEGEDTIYPINDGQEGEEKPSIDDNLSAQMEARGYSKEAVEGIRESAKEEKAQMDEAASDRELWKKSEHRFIPDEVVLKEERRPQTPSFGLSPTSSGASSYQGVGEKYHNVRDEVETNKASLLKARVTAQDIMKEGKVAVLWDGSVYKSPDAPLDAERVYVYRESDKTSGAGEYIAKSAPRQSLIANAVRRGIFKMYEYGTGGEVKSKDMLRDMQAKWDRETAAYDPSMPETLIATGLSFMMDEPLFGFGGKMGSGTYRGIVKNGRILKNQLIKSGVKKEAANEVFKRGTKMFLKSAPERIAGTAGALGTYDAVAELDRQLNSGIELEDIDKSEILKEATKGVVLGTTVGIIGQSAEYLKGSDVIRRSYTF